MNRSLIVGLALVVMLMVSNGAWASEKASREDLPYRFFLTHYELLGDPNNPDGVRYHSTGKPFAKAPDGSKIILSGEGGWDPPSKSAQGGGRYTIKDASGDLTARGSWQVTDFSSFEQFDGWWGMGPEFREKGWQGPPGSPSFSGFLTLEVNLENQGNGTLVAWCLMPEVLELHPHLANPDGHVGDGISLTGGGFDFADFSETEVSMEGVMFYSTDPTSTGYVLTSEGNAVRKTAADSLTATASASPGATATVSPLPTSGGSSLIGPITLVAALVLVGSAVAALALLRQGYGSA
jgi:hypothetical protein